MRIGLISGEYPPMQGGVGDFTHALASALRDQGHTLFVLTDQRAHGELQQNGIRVDARIARWGWRSLIEARRWAQSNRLDVVNIQYEAAAFGMGVPVHFLPRALGKIPAVVTFHDLLVPYLFPKAGTLRRGALSMLARSASGVIVTNRQDETQLRAAILHPEIRRIPIGSNIPTQPPPDFDRAAWRARRGIAPDTLLIGYFGFLNASKGIDTLLDGAALTLHQGIDAQVLMIGGEVGASDPANAAYQKQINAQIKLLEIVARVHWTGFASASDVSAHLLACDVIALPFRDGILLPARKFPGGVGARRRDYHDDTRRRIAGACGRGGLDSAHSPRALAAALITLAASPARRASSARRGASVGA